MASLQSKTQDSHVMHMMDPMRVQLRAAAMPYKPAPVEIEEMDKLNNDLAAVKAVEQEHQEALDNMKLLLQAADLIEKYTEQKTAQHHDVFAMFNRLLDTVGGEPAMWEPPNEHYDTWIKIQEDKIHELVRVQKNRLNTALTEYTTIADSACESFKKVFKTVKVDKKKWLQVEDSTPSAVAVFFEELPDNLTVGLRSQHDRYNSMVTGIAKSIDERLTRIRLLFPPSYLFPRLHLIDDPTSLEDTGENAARTKKFTQRFTRIIKKLIREENDDSRQMIQEVREVQDTGKDAIETVEEHQRYLEEAMNTVQQQMIKIQALRGQLLTTTGQAAAAESTVETPVI